MDIALFQLFQLIRISTDALLSFLLLLLKLSSWHIIIRHSLNFRVPVFSRCSSGKKCSFFLVILFAEPPLLGFSLFKVKARHLLQHFPIKYYLWKFPQHHRQFIIIFHPPVSEFQFSSQCNSGNYS